MGRPLISIIMPVYNTAPYLGEAVSSVLAQSWPDWELVITDDGSTDGSAGICDDWAARDSRIRVFHQENGGVSRARNRALAESRGEYVCFLDSDDYWEASCLKTLLSMQEKAGGIPVCCGYYAHEGGKKTAPAKKLPDNIQPLDDFLFEALIGRLSLPICCVTWLLPGEMARRIRFETDLGYGEDSLYMMQALQNYKEVYYDPEPLYHYRKERAGNTLEEQSLKKWESIYASNQRSYEICRGHLIKTEQVLLKHLVESAAAAARRAGKEGKREAYRLYKRRSLQAWKRLCSCRCISVHDRIRLLGYGLAPELSEKLMLRIYGRV